MAFNQFSGDVISTHYVAPVLKARNIFNSGEIQPYDLEINGAVATYKTLSFGSVNEGVRGRKLDLSAIEATRKDIVIDKSFAITALVSGATQKANAEEIVGEAALNATAQVIRERNIKGLEALVSKGTESTNTDALTSSNIYKVITDEAAAFVTRNAKLGLSPKVCYVSPAVYALLLQANVFTTKLTDTSVYSGIVGEVAGIKIIRVLEPIGEKVEFILGCEHSLLAPTSLDGSDFIAQVPGYAGASLYQEELAYAFEVVNADFVTVKKTA